MKKKKKLKKNSPEYIVEHFPTKHKEGFTSKEIITFIEEHKLNQELFFEKLGINTGMLKEGECLTYHCDILTAFKCILENREKTIYEWD